MTTTLTHDMAIREIQQIYPRNAMVYEAVCSCGYVSSASYSRRKAEQFIPVHVDNARARELAEARANCTECALPGMKPSHDGSKGCASGSIASGGTRAHCTCDVCF